MPELPEVETIARTLAPQVEGRRIVACELLSPSTFEGTIPLGKVVGGVIGRPGRRGKLLLLPLAFGSDPLPPVDGACPSGSLARCLACGDERITGLGFHLKMTAACSCILRAHLRKNIPGSSSTLTTVRASFSTMRANSAMCGFCRLPPLPAGRSGTGSARSRWRWTPMPSRLVLPGGGARSRRCSLISPCWRDAGIFTRTKACSARASGPTRSSCPPTA